MFVIGDGLFFPSTRSADFDVGRLWRPPGFPESGNPGGPQNRLKSKLVRKVAVAAVAAILFYDFETSRFWRSFPELLRFLLQGLEGQIRVPPGGPQNRRRLEMEKKRAAAAATATFLVDF